MNLPFRVDRSALLAICVLVAAFCLLAYEWMSGFTPAKMLVGLFLVGLVLLLFYLFSRPGNELWTKLGNVALQLGVFCLAGSIAIGAVLLQDQLSNSNAQNERAAKSNVWLGALFEKTLSRRVRVQNARKTVEHVQQNCSSGELPGPELVFWDYEYISSIMGAVRFGRVDDARKR